MIELSQPTLNILKNFATFDGGLVIQPGSKLAYKPSPAVFAEAEVAEDFPTEISIYDLSHFMSSVGLFKQPVFDFQSHFVLIVDGEAKMKYCYAPSALIKSKPLKKLPALPKQVIEFDLPENKWIAIQKATSALKKDEVRITADGADVRVEAYSHKDPNGHSFSVAVAGRPNGLRCSTILAVANLRLLKGSYRCTVTPNYVVFTNTGGYDLKYYVACEASSTFGESSN